MGKIILNGVEYVGGGSENGHNYSTSEQVVGTWVDGKPVYETTYVFQSDVRINASSWEDTPIPNSGIKRIISCETSNLQGAFWQVLGAAIDTGDYVRFFNGRSNNFIDVGVVVLRYMKTAD